MWSGLQQVMRMDPPLHGISVLIRRDNRELNLAHAISLFTMSGQSKKAADISRQEGPQPRFQLWQSCPTLVDTDSLPLCFISSETLANSAQLNGEGGVIISSRALFVKLSNTLLIFLSLI